ncbi:MAG TPA: hypothetical protein VEA78_06965, partial [Acidimicrobiales bacterium]|nr:hypothetical protein [Acidimicrobiales bacterium]
MRAIERAIEEWSTSLVLGWDSWVDVATRVCDVIGLTLLGASPGETLAADSTTVNLHKLMGAAVGARDGVVVCSPAEFPTDR